MPQTWSSEYPACRRRNGPAWHQDPGRLAGSTRVWLTDAVDDAADVSQGAEGFEVVEAADRQRFELRWQGEVLAFASYLDGEGSVVIPHVETLGTHRGRGHATRLMDGIIEILQADGRTIVANCSFAASYMRDHPQLDHLRA